jgi:serine/threonine protein kinase
VVIRKRRSYKQTSISEDQRPPSDVRVGKTKSKLMTGISDCVENPFMYSIEDLEKATQNFSPLCNIEGSVYKGTLDGRDYAINLMKGDISQELEILQKVNHTNLVKLEGVCISSEGQSYLVYEYIENSSLNTWLHDPESVENMSPIGWSSSSLPWKMSYCCKCNGNCRIHMSSINVPTE